MRQTLPHLFHRPYAGFAARTFLRGYKRILKVFPKDGPTLDVGCGPGDVTKHLAKTRDAVGVDIDPRMVALAKRRVKQRPGLEFQVADAADLPFEMGSFANAWTSESFHHWDDKEAGLREVMRVLRPGGQLWIVEGRADMSRAEFREAFGLPALPGLFGAARMAFRTHGVTASTAEDLRAMLERVGYRSWLERFGGWMVILGRRPE